MDLETYPEKNMFKWGCPKCFKTFTTVGRDGVGHWDDLLTEKEKAFIMTNNCHGPGKLRCLSPEEAKKAVQCILKLWEDHFGTFEINATSDKKERVVYLN